MGNCLAHRPSRHQRLASLTYVLIQTLLSAESLSLRGMPGRMIHASGSSRPNPAPSTRSLATNRPPISESAYRNDLLHRIRDTPTEPDAHLDERISVPPFRDGLIVDCEQVLVSPAWNVAPAHSAATLSRTPV